MSGRPSRTTHSDIVERTAAPPASGTPAIRIARIASPPVPLSLNTT